MTTAPSAPRARSPGGRPAEPCGGVANDLRDDHGRVDIGGQIRLAIAEQWKPAPPIRQDRLPRLAAPRPFSRRGSEGSRLPIRRECEVPGKALAYEHEVVAVPEL